MRKIHRLKPNPKQLKPEAKTKAKTKSSANASASAGRGSANGHQRIKFLGGVRNSSDVERLKLPSGASKVVFAGRSNVGKSSLLNAFIGSKVARVSAEPGKTREMNFFDYRPSLSDLDRWVLVDLPGYGYAKVAMSLRKQWGEEITQWLQTDQQLAVVIALVDGRHGFLENDLELVEFLQNSKLPYAIAFTKMDKWKSQNQRRFAESKLKDFAEKLGILHYCFVSAQSRDGIRELQKLLSKWPRSV